MLFAQLNLGMAEAAGAVQGKEKTVFPPFDPTHFLSQIFWLALSFLLLYLVLSNVLLPRLSGLLEERRDRIADDLDAAARMQDEAKQAEHAYKKALAEARAKAHTLADHKQVQTKKELAQDIAETEARLAKQQAAAQERIGKASLEATKHVRSIALQTAHSVLTAVTPKIKPDSKTLEEAVDQAESESL